MGSLAVVMAVPFQVLPGTGRGTAARSVVVEGNGTDAGFPSTMLRMVPLPVPGRIWSCT
jgi:hypothetical protein